MSSSSRQITISWYERVTMRSTLIHAENWLNIGACQNFEWMLMTLKWTVGRTMFAEQNSSVDDNQQPSLAVDFNLQLLVISSLSSWFKADAINCATLLSCSTRVWSYYWSSSFPSPAFIHFYLSLFVPVYLSVSHHKKALDSISDVASKRNGISVQLIVWLQWERRLIKIKSFVQNRAVRPTKLINGSQLSEIC